MKKMILLLAVLLMTAPAMAEVVITVTDSGDGWAVISYDASGETDFVRAFALDITASNDVTFVDYDSADANYWVYPGSIDINDAGLVEDEGSPIAAGGSPGALGGLGTNGVTIEMGALFEAGVDDPPAAEGVLLRLQLDPAATADAANVCVVGNAMRGNIVMKNASSQAIDPAACQVVQLVPPVLFCDEDVDKNGFVNKNDRNAVLTYLNLNATAPFWSVAVAAGTPEDVDKNGFVNKNDRNAVLTYLNLNATAPFWSVACP